MAKILEPISGLLENKCKVQGVQVILVLSPCGGLGGIERKGPLLSGNSLHLSLEIGEFSWHH